jgi:predicted translin family RNA/ssDNA-binding protein
MNKHTVNVKIDAAKKQISQTGKKYFTSFRNRTDELVGQFSDKVSETRRLALTKVADKSIAVTKSQLRVLNNFKAKIQAQ